MVEVLAPIEAEPAHVALDGVDIFLLFLGRVGVVKTQITVTAAFLGDTEIQAERFCMDDMKVAVRLRRKAGDHSFDPPGVEIGFDDVADKVAARFCCRAVWSIVGRHASSSSESKPLRLCHDVPRRSMSIALTISVQIMVQGA